MASATASNSSSNVQDLVRDELKAAIFPVESSSNVILEGMIGMSDKN